MESKSAGNNTFSAISINRITAERFRVYSKTVSKSHSETIDTMIDFFENANVAPKNEVIIGFIRFQNYLNGRFDFIEELLRTMEREQLKPTHDMLKSLFDGTALNKREEILLEERKNIRMTKEEWNREEGKVSSDKYYKAVDARNEEQVKFLKVRRRFLEVVNLITKVEPTFGRPYFKIEVDSKELEALKNELKNS